MKNRTQIRAGWLDKWVTIQAATEGDPSASGETTKTWADKMQVWCMVQPQSGREYYRAKQVTPELTHVLTMRYSGQVSVTSDMRVKLGARLLAIISVRNVDEQNVALELVCKEEPQ